jgi:hypothetical protein
LQQQQLQFQQQPPLGQRQVDEEEGEAPVVVSEGMSLGM